MKRTRAFLFVVIVLFACLGCKKEASGPPHLVRFNTNDGKVVFEVDLADTLDKRKEGLKPYRSLPEERGLLFIFSDEILRTIDVEEINFAIDVVLISSSGQVVEIIENIDPRLVVSTLANNASKYMLQINSGLVKKYGIEVEVPVSLLIY